MPENFSWFRVNQIVDQFLPIIHKFITLNKYYIPINYIKTVFFGLLVIGQTLYFRGDLGAKTFMQFLGFYSISVYVSVCFFNITERTK